MSFSQLLVLIKDVLVSREVVLIAVLLLLYLKLVCYIVKYQKPKLPPLRSRLKAQAQKSAPEPKKV